ncbi:putative Fe-S oxidoreductase [Pseudonocardia sp. N23]|nr:putative Fe-S oxidoreductase [Pseudonocardia sp. N23]
MPIGWLVVAGVVLVAVVVGVVVALRRRRRRAAERTTAALLAPVAEAAVPGEPPHVVSEPASAGADVAAPQQEPAVHDEPAAPDETAAPLPVAEVPAAAKAAVAPSVATVGDLAALRGGSPVVAPVRRDPDTTPLPVSSDVLLQRAAARRASTSVRVRVPERGAAALAERPADETNVAAPWLRVDLTLADDATGPDDGPVTTGDATASAGDEPGAGAPGAGLQDSAATVADTGQPVAAQPEVPGPRLVVGHHDPARHDPAEPAGPATTVLRAVPAAAGAVLDRTPADESPGAGHSLAGAVANALANREAATQAAAGRGAAGRTATDRTATADRGRPQPEEPDVAARDRLLAVLLEDPDRAVGATVELGRVQGQLDRLLDAVRHEQDALAGLVERLAAAGLGDEQIARLAGIPVAEVSTLRTAGP